MAALSKSKLDLEQCSHTGRIPERPAVLRCGRIIADLDAILLGGSYTCQLEQIQTIASRVVQIARGAWLPCPVSISTTTLSAYHSIISKYR
jgi:hypothetical protein